MAKLYPPYIEGTLPAFCLDNQGNGKLVIPFAHNRAISSQEEISSFAIKIKSVQNDVLFGDVNIGANWDGDNEVEFEIINWQIAGLTELTFKIGQYYKIQLAYIDKNGSVGYYSTVGVVKCTSKPEVSIANFNKDKVNNNAAEFIGLFKQAENGDVSEKVYSSKFIITDLSGNEIFNSGDTLHSIENNPNSYESQDIVYFNRDLNYGEIYRIEYIVTTTNGLVYPSPKYLLTQQKSIAMEVQGSLKAECNEEEGYIDVSIVSALIGTELKYTDPQMQEREETLNITLEDLNDYINTLKSKGYQITFVKEGVKEIVDGMFIVAREDSLAPGVWEELTRFSLKHETPSRTIFRDFTIEQGKTYTYSLQQYNANGIYSDRKKSNKVYADFEDMFLYDGERQLKLRFNPQVSSFKTQLAETRTETIGSKYPFFFRNARIGYKTFPLSGLVSMVSDDNQFFISYKDISRTNYSYGRETTGASESLRMWPPIINKNTDLTSDNFASERLFKLEVLNWLNDGHVKLFRSPAEGNYLVRLMETSLTPNTQVGRMLHTVNTTAYECAEMNYHNLIENNIIKEVDINDEDTFVTSWYAATIDNEFIEERSSKIVTGAGLKTKALSASPDRSISNINLMDDVHKDSGDAYTTILRFIDCLPGDQIRLVFDASGNKDNKDHVDIIIGSTGNYYADDIRPVYGIYFLSDLGYDSDINYNRSGYPTVTFQYNGPNRTTFRSIENIQADVGGYNQFVGEIFNLVNYLSFTREAPTQLCFSRYFKRPVEYLYYTTDEIPDIISGESVFDGTYNYWGYRNLIDKYSYCLSWDISTKHLSQSEREERMRKNVFQKTKNENGLSEDWWEVQDWARYYAQVQALLEEKNIELMSEEELRSYYPTEKLYNYKKSDWQGQKPDEISIQLGYGGTNQLGIPLLDTNVTRYQVIYDIPSESRWIAHASSCTHDYLELLPGSSSGAGVPSNATVYVYKPTFGGEVSYSTDAAGNTIIDMSAYKGREESPEWFDDQESMEYSPFSLYVLRNQYVTTLDGVRQNIYNHLPSSLPVEEKTHIVNHAFERYYIDRYINAQTPQEMLEERTLLAQRLATDENSDETEAVDAATALYVLDPWYGKVYKVGKDFIYNPSINYNNENIDLREIDRYELEGMEPTETRILVGNGVYGDIFYQKVEQTFSYEPAVEKALWESAKNAVKTATVGYQEEAEERAAYKALNDAIDAAREDWQALVGDNGGN